MVLFYTLYTFSPACLSDISRLYLGHDVQVKNPGVILKGNNHWCPVEVCENVTLHAGTGADEMNIL